MIASSAIKKKPASQTGHPGDCIKGFEDFAIVPYTDPKDAIRGNGKFDQLDIKAKLDPNKPPAVVRHIQTIP